MSRWVWIAITGVAFVAGMAVNRLPSSLQAAEQTSAEVPSSVFLEPNSNLTFKSFDTVEVTNEAKNVVESGGGGGFPLALNKVVKTVEADPVLPYLYLYTESSPGCV